MSIRAFRGVVPTIDPGAYVDESAVVIGDVQIADGCSIWPMTVIRGDVNTIRIGARTNIQDGSILHVTHDGPHAPGGFPLTIGEGNTVGHRAILHGCRIGNHCLIGMAATIMDGAVLPDRVILGAGSLVTPGKVLESGYLYMGSPARKVRPLTDAELASLEYSAAHYMKLREQHRGGA